MTSKYDCISCVFNIRLLLSGHGPPPGLPLHHNIPPGADTDISNDSSPRGYPDFPPSPDSWLGEPSSAHYWPPNNIFDSILKMAKKCLETFILVFIYMCWGAQLMRSISNYLYKVFEFIEIYWNWLRYSGKNSIIILIFII